MCDFPTHARSIKTEPLINRQMNTKIFCSALIILIALSACNNVSAQNEKKDYNLKKWEPASSPEVIGEKVTNRFINSPFMVSKKEGRPDVIAYPEVCTWYGALTFSKENKNKELKSRLVDRFNPLFGADSTLIPTAHHVDFSVFGAVPLQLYMLTKDARYLAIGKDKADRQWILPDEKKDDPVLKSIHNKGLSWQTRMWIDDMYMITLLQALAYRATGDKKYIDRAAAEMTVYLDSLQKPNGLFYHAPDVPFYWGRGNGWMAAGMTELLGSLPANNPHRPRIMEGYRKMMASLLKYQTKEGMWLQLIDDPESWPETSSTGMFTFAMISGVKNGWLDEKTYGAAARKGWLGLISYIDENGDIREVCQGTGKRNDRQYYLDRQRITGDKHGQAPVLWCATALLR